MRTNKIFTSIIKKQLGYIKLSHFLLYGDYSEITASFAV